MAATALNTAEVHRDLLKELPFILEESPEIQRTILRISGRSFADADESDRRFDQMFEELRKDRELSEKRWKANQQRFEKDRELSEKRWKENQQRFEEIQCELREQREENQNRWEENQKRWEENENRWEENKQRWEELQRQSNERFEFLVNEIKALHTKHESTLGALGSRWGIAAESSFRDGLKDILEHDFGVQVLNITEYDDDGEVFGHPDQIELDIIIKNGTLIICEIQSSISRSEMYTFYRKVQFYEKRHQRKATKLMVISPMVDQRARAVAEKLGITVHSYADDVQL